ncbi:hypothetical protein G5I_03795 [Acromyrmex echinatior]|uniref:Uncharacterized protein n=1 Tax=Acromyrmex echinatior TaxID=103372 RepID=F4WDX0_ACREC|nr:hypothetical protein G5I_03795 [Acromyrmex echinatior]
MTLKILLESLLIAAVTSSVLSSSEDHHRVLLRSHRIVLPVWNHDRLYPRHDHLDDERIVRETTATTTKNPWMLRSQVSMTRSSQQINSASRHIEQRMLEQKFNGAVAMTENGGTRAIAYAGYHSNHRHQPREMGTQSFQPISTTVPTYTRHHSGINRQLRSLWTSVRQEANGVRERKLHPPKKMSELGDSAYGDARKSRLFFFLLTNYQRSWSCSLISLNCVIYDRPHKGGNCEARFQIILRWVVHEKKRKRWDLTFMKSGNKKLQVARNRKRDTEASEMNTKVTLAIESVNEMKRTVENVQLMQQEVYDMRSRMRQYEAEMRKIHHLMNRVAELENRLRIHCRYQ